MSALYRVQVGFARPLERVGRDASDRQHGRKSNGRDHGGSLQPGDGSRRCGGDPKNRERGSSAGIVRLGIERRNFSFPAPRSFYSATGKRRLDTTDQSSIRPSLALARPGPQSSAAFSSHQSSQNHPAPTPRRNQISIDGQLPRRCPAGALFGGSRTPALGPCPVDCSPCAGIRNPNRHQSFTWRCSALISTQ